MIAVWHAVLETKSWARKVVLLSWFLMIALHCRKNARSLQSCVSILRDLVFCGVVDLSPQTVNPVPFVHSGSSTITSLALETQLVSSGTIRNLFAFQALQQIFLEAATDELCAGVMTHVHEIVVKVWSIHSSGFVPAHFLTTS